MVSATRWIGVPLKRKEDPPLLTGSATFVDNIDTRNMIYAAVLRSPYAHARIKNIDVTTAMRHPGVVATLTGQEVKKLTKPVSPVIPMPIEMFPMAIEKVRYVGEPVAAVAAVSRADAADALELIKVDYEPLPPVADAEEAMKPDAPLVFEELGSNIAVHDKLEYGDMASAFSEADKVVEETLRIHRYTSSPLETNGCIAAYDQVTGVLTIWSNSAFVGILLDTLQKTLGMETTKIRLLTPSVGGSFGLKGSAPRAVLIIVCLLSMLTGRPVKWIEDRREHLIAGGHACNSVFRVQAAVKNDGTVLALKVKEIDDEGGSPGFAGYHVTNKLNNLTGAYKVKNISIEFYSVMTNKCPTAANRGVGKPAMCFIWERMMDRVAEELGLDRVAVRLRNFIQPSEFPYETPNGNVYGSGDYPTILKKALDKIGYDTLRADQARLRQEGRYIGLGISTSVEPGGSNLARHYILASKPHRTGAFDGCTIKMEHDGKVFVNLGSNSSGQGHSTTTAQIVAEVMGITPDDVEVATIFDSASSPWTIYSGRWGNNFTAVGVGAVVGAVEKIKDKVRRIAAYQLDANPESIEVSDGKAFVRDSPKRAKTLKEIAQTAYFKTLDLPPGMEPGLYATCIYNYPYANVADEKRRIRSQFTFGGSAHLAVVEIDAETGFVRLLRYVIVADAGNMINPLIVEGQIHGATAHGISAALGEEFIYDQTGQPLTATFMDYLKPTSMDSANIEVSHVEIPDPFTMFGAKGVGEGGALLSPAAIASAVEDALRPFDAKVTELPMTPEKVWTLVKSQRGV